MLYINFIFTVASIENRNVTPAAREVSIFNPLHIAECIKCCMETYAIAGKREKKK